MKKIITIFILMLTINYVYPEEDLNCLTMQPNYSGYMCAACCLDAYNTYKNEYDNTYIYYIHMCCASGRKMTYEEMMSGEYDYLFVMGGITGYEFTIWAEDFGFVFRTSLSNTSFPALIPAIRHAHALPFVMAQTGEYDHHVMIVGYDTSNCGLIKYQDPDFKGAVFEKAPNQVSGWIGSQIYL